MKKLLVFLSIIFLSSGSVSFAACDYSCTTPYDKNSKFRTFVGAVTGVNTITEIAAEKALRKEVLKYGSAQKLDVNIDSFSSKDLKNGIFKSAQIQAENAQVKGIYATAINLKALCDFNYLKKVDKDLVIVEDLPMSFNIELTANDINKTMEHPNYKRIIDDLNKLGATYGYGIKIASTVASVKNSKFYYVIKFEIPFIRKLQKIVLEADVNVKNGEIIYTNTKLVSGFISLDTKKLDFILDYLNPLDFSVNIIDNKEANIKVKTVKIKDNKIFADGVVVIPKD